MNRYFFIALAAIVSASGGTKKPFAKVVAVQIVQANQQENKSSAEVKDEVPEKQSEKNIDCEAAKGEAEKSDQVPSYTVGGGRFGDNILSDPPHLQQLRFPW